MYIDSGSILDEIQSKICGPCKEVHENSTGERCNDCDWQWFKNLIAINSENR